MSYKAKDIANKIIAKTDTERGDTISNLKLQKLLYYIQGFNLAILGKPLFDEEIEAWHYGPVVPSVFHEFKIFGAGTISLDQDTEIIQLSEEEEALFNSVYDEYSQFSAVKLMNMTHDEEPWKSAEISHKISKSVISKYFKENLVDYES